MGTNRKRKELPAPSDVAMEQASHRGVENLTGPEGSHRIEGIDPAEMFALLSMPLINYWALMDNDKPCPEWLTAFFALDEIMDGVPTPRWRGTVHVRVD